MRVSARGPRLALGLLAALLVVPGCIELESEKDEDTGGSGSGSGGSGGGSGSDGSGGAGVGGGSGGDTDLDGICDDPPSPTPYDGACITASLGCEESLVSTTEGGSQLLSGADYASFWACEVVGTSDYVGPERMFEIDHPGDGWIQIDLSTPCNDLDIFAMRWESASCVQSGLSILECEGGIRNDNSVRIWNNEPARYVVVVEGPGGQEEPFGLSMTCEHGG